MKTLSLAAAVCLAAVAAARAMNQTPSKLVVRGAIHQSAPFRPPIGDQAVGDVYVTIDGEILSTEGDFGIFAYAPGQRFRTSVVMNPGAYCSQGTLEFLYPPRSFCSAGEPCPARAALPIVRLLSCDAK